MLMKGSWLVDNRTMLEDLIRRVGHGSPDYNPTAPPFAVFDWDQTVIRHDIGDAFFLHQINTLGFALEHDEFWRIVDAEDVSLRSRVAALRHLPPASVATRSEFFALRDAILTGYIRAGALDPQLGFPWQTRILAGLTPEAVWGMTRTTVENELTLPLGRREIPVNGMVIRFHQGLRPYAEILDLIRALEAHGIAAWVVSATNVWAVQAIAEVMGVRVDRVIGMRTLVKDGVITSELDGDAVATWGKVKAIQRYIHPTQRPVLVAGDNITDLPMLDYSADTRLVIDRGVVALRETAEARRASGEAWLIQPAFEVM